MDSRKKFIDASNLVAGRLASYVAKLALEGYEIYVFNAEKAIITGNREWVLKKFKEKVDRGDWYKGPFYPKRPDRILRRIIRGMLPWHKDRGRKAFSRIKVFVGVPKEFENIKLETIDEAKPKFERGEEKYVTLLEVSKFLGAKLYNVEGQ